MTHRYPEWAFLALVSIYAVYSQNWLALFGFVLALIYCVMLYKVVDTLKMLNDAVKQYVGKK